jgi:hypothetical protein
MNPSNTLRDGLINDDDNNAKWPTKGDSNSNSEGTSQLMIGMPTIPNGVVEEGGVRNLFSRKQSMKNMQLVLKKDETIPSAFNEDFWKSVGDCRSKRRPRLFISVITAFCTMTIFFLFLWWDGVWNNAGKDLLLTIIEYTISAGVFLSVYFLCCLAGFDGSISAVIARHWNRRSHIMNVSFTSSVVLVSSVLSVLNADCADEGLNITEGFNLFCLCQIGALSILLIHCVPLPRVNYFLKVDDDRHVKIFEDTANVLHQKPSTSGKSSPVPESDMDDTNTLIGRMLRKFRSSHRYTFFYDGTIQMSKAMTILHYLIVGIIYSMLFSAFCYLCSLKQPSHPTFISLGLSLVFGIIFIIFTQLSQGVKHAKWYYMYEQSKTEFSDTPNGKVERQYWEVVGHCKISIAESEKKDEFEKLKNDKTYRISALEPSEVDYIDKDDGLSLLKEYRAIALSAEVFSFSNLLLCLILMVNSYCN